MLGIVILGAVGIAFGASMLAVLVLGGLGWAATRWLGAYAAMGSAALMLICSVVLGKVMLSMGNDPAGKDAGGFHLWIMYAMAPALICAVIFGALFVRAAR